MLNLIGHIETSEEMVQFKAFFNEWFLRDTSRKVRNGKRTRAKEGKVIYTDFRTNEQSDNNTNNNTTNNENNNQTDNTKEITLEEAKEIALKHANLKEENLTLIKEQEDTDDGIAIYDIEWRDATYEYDFEISTSGEVLQYDKEKIND